MAFRIFRRLNWITKKTANRRVLAHSRRLAQVEFLERRECPAVGLWQGVLGTGNLTGSGNGLQINSSSGTVSAVVDTSGAARSFSINGNGTGSLTLSGITCSGGGFGLTSNGTVQDRQITSSFSGSGQGSCPPPVSGSGTIGYEGSLTGSLNSALTTASGTWTANWSSSFGNLGTLNGNWTASGGLVNDLKPTQIAWSNRSADVQLNVEISGANLPVVSSFDVVWKWASGTSTSSVIGTAGTSTVSQTAVGTYQTTVSPSNLSAIPQGATHLLAVVDDANAVLESQEGNNVIAVAIPIVAPNNNPPQAQSLADVLANEDQTIAPISLLGGFTDDLDAPSALTYAVVGNTNPSLFSATSVNQSQDTLALTLAANANGTATLTIRATDTSGASAETTLAVTVAAVNDAPQFSHGPHVTVPKDAGPQNVAGWAHGISKGPANESSQDVSFEVSTNDAALFAVLPAISPDGTLTYTPAAGQTGQATVNVVLRDNGGTANQGVDHTDTRTFQINIGASVTVTNLAGPLSVRAGGGTPVFTSAQVNSALQSWNGVKMTIALTDPQSGDDLDFNSTRTLRLSRGQLRLGKVLIGTVTESSTQISVTFTSSATTALVNQILRQIEYSASSRATGGTRHFALAFTQGQTPVSAALTQEITVTPRRSRRA